jgi:hypothetical protein
MSAGGRDYTVPSREGSVLGKFSQYPLREGKDRKS